MCHDRWNTNQRLYTTQALCQREISVALQNALQYPDRHLGNIILPNPDSTLPTLSSDDPTNCCALTNVLPYANAALQALYQKQSLGDGMAPAALNPSQLCQSFIIHNCSTRDDIRITHRYFVMEWNAISAPLSKAAKHGRCKSIVHNKKCSSCTLLCQSLYR